MIRVLVVDDDFMVVKIHSGFVNAVPGFGVVGVAHTARDAIAAVEKHDPDLILLDIYLPDMNGLDLLQRLREVKPELEVLVISAAREMETVRRALRGGIIHYLMKPFSREALTERLEHYRATYVPLESVEHELDQDDVNRLLGLGAPERKPLPKGCSAETLEAVEAILKDAKAPISASETGAELGTSRVSARRYLEYLADSHQVKVVLKYGGVGRPERRYEWSGRR